MTPPAGIALDIETYCEDPEGSALNPFKGKIRLVSIANSEGLKTFDLKKAPLSRELLETIRTSELIIQNAAFELRWFGRHFGFVPKSVFCTKTADKLLIPGETIRHRLEDIVERRLGLIINKEIDHKAWGDDVLTERQLEYARIDVEHMYILRKIFDAELKAADLTRIFKLESDLLPIVAKMELHGFAVSVERMEKIRSREDEVAEELERTIRAEFNLPELNVNSPPQLLVAFNNSGENLKSTGGGVPHSDQAPDAAPKFSNTASTRNSPARSRDSWKRFKTTGYIPSSSQSERFTGAFKFEGTKPPERYPRRIALVFYPEQGRKRPNLRGLFANRTPGRGAYRAGRHDD